MMEEDKEGSQGNSVNRHLSWSGDSQGRLWGEVTSPSEPQWGRWEVARVKDMESMPRNGNRMCKGFREGEERILNGPVVLKNFRVPGTPCREGGLVRSKFEGRPRTPAGGDYGMILKILSARSHDLGLYCMWEL